MIHSNLRRTMVEEKCEIFEGFFFSILKNIHFAVDPNERGEFS